VLVLDQRKTSTSTSTSTSTTLRIVFVHPDSGHVARDLVAIEHEQQS